MDFCGLDDAFGVDHERAAQRQAFFFDVHVKHAGQLVGRVTHQSELRLAHGGRGFVPDFVREMGVGGDHIDFDAALLERLVVVGQVFYFGGAVEGEGGGHEHQHRPFAMQVFFRHVDELAVFIGLGFEGLDLGVDDGHGFCFSG